MIISPETLIKKSNYRIIRQIGSGLFGQCFLVEDQKNKKMVFKAIKPEAAIQTIGKEHYEEVFLSSISHPYIPKYFGTIYLFGSKFLAMEFIEGFTLEYCLFSKKKAYSLENIRRIGLQLLSIIAYLTNRNIVHRDISISNILDNGNNIFLIDFGLARCVRYDKMGMQSDFHCFGEIILFLLYSRWNPTDKKHRTMAWYDELTLNDFQKLYIARLLKLEKPYLTVSDVKENFITFIDSLKYSSFFQRL
ncbi:protein kinase domain-containing protein [Anaerotignum sp.]|uniref:protein kinase domain-containing protein n=1 Tax=Anaerotignum sp. TaxID=2039241 RepID=UPI00289C5541|nr:protein kinase [Anaerotignum sp.]